MECLWYPPPAPNSSSLLMHMLEGNSDGSNHCVPIWEIRIEFPIPDFEPGPNSNGIWGINSSLELSFSLCVSHLLKYILKSSEHEQDFCSSCIRVPCLDCSFLPMGALGIRIMTQEAWFLPHTWDTKTEFLAPGFSQSGPGCYRHLGSEPVDES